MCTPRPVKIAVVAWIVVIDGVIELVTDKGLRVQEMILRILQFRVLPQRHRHDLYYLRRSWALPVVLQIWQSLTK